MTEDLPEKPEKIQVEGSIEKDKVIITDSHFKNSRLERKFKKLEVIHTSHIPAPESTVTVAPFQAWRSSQLLVAREPMQITLIMSANYG